jgi:hypothetical protein
MRTRPTPSRAQRQDRGAAIILVFVTLTALLLVAVPFVFAMNRSLSAAYAERDQLDAKHDARSIYELTVAALRPGTAVNESRFQRNPGDPRLRFINENMSVYGGSNLPVNPDVDGAGEIAVQGTLQDMLREVGGDRDVIQDVSSGRAGRLWSVTVRDEQGKINVDSASLWLLSNIFGGTHLTVQAEPGASSFTVDDASMLPRNGGYIVVLNELIRYDRISPAGENWVISGLARGVGDGGDGGYELATDALGPLPPGTPVVPGVAYKIHRYKAEPARQRTAAIAMTGSPERANAILNWFKDVDAVRLIDTVQKFPGSNPSEHIPPEMWEAVRDDLTVYSVTPKAVGFTGTHVLATNLPPTGDQPQQGEVRPVASHTGGPGLRLGDLVRIQREDGLTEYAFAVGNNVLDRMPVRQFLAHRTTFDRLSEPRINVNTASTRVLEAVFTGLSTNSNHIVTRRQARLLAYLIAGQRAAFQDHTGFAGFVQRQAGRIGLSPQDVDAIRRNAVNPRDVRFGTAGFTYRTYDTFTIDSRAVRLADPGPLAPTDSAPGVPLGRHARRDILTIGSAGMLGTASFTSFEELQQAGSFTGVNKLRITPRGVAENTQLGAIERPYKGEFTPQGNDDRYRHWDWSGDGQPFNDANQLALEIDQLGTRAGNSIDMTAGNLTLWIRPDRVSGTETILFDASGEETANRFTLLWDSRRSALVLRIADPSLERSYIDKVFPGLPEEGADASESAFRNGNWYHVNIAWKGTRHEIIERSSRVRLTAGNARQARQRTIPIRLMMTVDGLGASPRNYTPSYTTYTRYNSPGGRPIEQHTRLTQLLAEPPPHALTDGDIHEIRDGDEMWHQVVVESTEGFPNQGVIEIGGEAITYTRREDNVFTGTIEEVDLPDGTTRTRLIGFKRAARGTRHREHIAGSSVAPFGYSAPLVTGETHSPRSNGAEAPSLIPVNGYSQQVIDASADRAINANPGQPDDDNFWFRGHEADAGLPTNGTLPAGLPSGANVEPINEIRGPRDAFEGWPQSGYVMLVGQHVARWESVTDPSVPNPPPPPPGEEPEMKAIAIWEPAVEIVYYSGIIDGSKEIEGQEEPFEYSALVISRRNALPPRNMPPGQALPAVPDGGLQWRPGFQIRLISWQLDTIDGYIPGGADTMQNPRFIYLEVGGRLGDDECIRYNQTTTDGYLVWNNVADSRMRGALQTPRRDYAGGEKAVPVFAVVGTDNAHRPVGPGDQVTIIDRKNGGKQGTWLDSDQPLRIAFALDDDARNRMPTQQNQNAQVTCEFQWVALDDFVQREYLQRNATRLVKFPSHELPIGVPRRMRFGRPHDVARGGTTAGFVDEVEIRGLSSAYFATEHPTPGVTPHNSDGPQALNRVYIGSPGGLNRRIGLIQIDDELIAYRGMARDSSGVFLDNCIRGALGTEIRPHAENSLYINISNARMARLPDALPAQSGRNFRIQHETGDPLDDYGYVLVVDGTDVERTTDWEIIGYKRDPRQRNNLIVSDFAPNELGLFRGAFGTTISDHPANSLLFKMPYRYVDHYHDPVLRSLGRGTEGIATPTGYMGPRIIETPDQTALGGALAAPGGRWRSVNLLVEADRLGRLVGEDGAHTVITLLLKPSTVASWSDPAVRRVVFDVDRAEPFGTSAGAVVLRTRAPLDDLPADGIEWRLAFAFTQGAFRADAWKYTPRVLGLYFEYRTEDRVYHSRALPR